MRTKTSRGTEERISFFWIQDGRLAFLSSHGEKRDGGRSFCSRRGHGTCASRSFRTRVEVLPRRSEEKAEAHVWIELKLLHLARPWIETSFQRIGFRTASRSFPFFANTSRERGDALLPTTNTGLALPTNERYRSIPDASRVLLRIEVSSRSERFLARSSFRPARPVSIVLRSTPFMRKEGIAIVNE